MQGRTPMTPSLTVQGFDIYKGFLERESQVRIVNDLRAVARCAPFFSPVMPSGKPMSVRMTSAGRLGWVTDQAGYRYQHAHPNGTPWPEIPASVQNIWKAVAGTQRQPDCCLINFYGETAKMGMHQDKDEGDFAFPVVSVSLGDEALFRMGNSTRGGATSAVWLQSGDVVVMGGAARLAYHGIDRLRFGSSGLLPEAGRINLTLRVVQYE